MKRIALLGATGSIGTQALEVVRACPNDYCITLLTARTRFDELMAQAIEFKPEAIVLGSSENVKKAEAIVASWGGKVFCGEAGILEALEAAPADMVITALVGYAGLMPTLKAIELGMDIGLANKETLVVAGSIVMKAAKAKGVSVLPIDSEHSAIYQCLQGEQKEDIEQLILTASGGPFRGKDRSFLSSVTKAQALKHPNWSMGAKITIDSATLMNKGLEVIEAMWLFDVAPKDIKVVVHPQSIIHSMVQFKDGSIKAQLGMPDMRLPIQFAMAYPGRQYNPFPRYDFLNGGAFTFEAPDTEVFQNLALAYEAIERKGNLPCILNAANEIAVERFLNEEIGFLDIAAIAKDCMAKVSYLASPALEDLVQTDAEARIRAKEWCV
jgi:1-deoxy-D-xylulose-5-phosphate reductoisomerase